MLPLVWSNVLLQNLLARKRYRVVPVLLLTLLCYLHAEARFGTSFLRVIQVLGSSTWSSWPCWARPRSWTSGDRLRPGEVTR